MGIISEILTQSVPGLTEDNRLSLRLVERLGEMLASPPLWGFSQLVVDGTGVLAMVGCARKVRWNVQVWR